ncbi:MULTISPECIES: class I SAM-dependent methyltransferase [unclassified Methanoculleus]|jgi:ubiquinone/menaquinone biosynthesis C-methylase UbiE|uniref:Methyltransferase domain-containing protein n=1 Tax=Methanoculleus palmolei TaxID=72612 RepID=A0ABD8A864_9EURY|nr:class I SAM-dependent methyltransferase [Methanoculleus sp. UBA377]WOX55217.1 methyltransferase domain-containing protein [Methanoculleus palmolei]
MDDNAMKSHIAQTWSAEAGYYDNHVSHGVQTDEEKKLWMEVFSALLPGNALHILDVGCGTGAMGLILAGMGHTVAGIDLSEGMMAIGRKKAEEQNLPMTFLTGDAEHPPFEPETFDAVINRHLLWTLPHPETALASWHRVLKPRGVVMVIDGVWDDGSFGAKVRRGVSSGIARIVEAHPHGDKGYSDEVRAALPNLGGVPEETARRYLTDAGFGDIAVQDLARIRENQRKRLKWYEKINPRGTYYLISGRKGIE